MNYQDTSGALGTGAIDARNDADTLPVGDRGPAVGNVISGTGTVSGAAGADTVTNGPAQVVEVQGAGGIAAGGGLQVAGQFGNLNMSADGDFRYMPNADAPTGARDIFAYTIADTAGARDSATLTIEIGRTPNAIRTDAQQVVPGPDGVVVLPAGVELSDIHVVGRNLIIDLPDGSQMVIIDGAVFVPQLVLGGVEVPATNLAALLIDAEPTPAAGTPQSSGGNFGLPPGPLDPGVPLGDLIPPTELDYTPPEFEDVGQFEDREPEIFVQPDGQPASVAAVDSVDESALPARPVNEPAGSNAASTAETTTGTIIYDSPDEPNVITIDGLGAGGPVVITSVGQVIQGAYGTLTITSIADGVIGYSYTLADNTSGDDTHDDFTVSITDGNDDVATATLRIDIVDDVPTARNDSDTIAAGQVGPATGNVITDASAGDIGDSDTNAADTVGADNARVTSIDNTANAAAALAVPATGTVNIAGQYGTLTIAADGSYSYVRGANTPGGVTETFNYVLTDGDGDTSTATLTISIGDLTVTTGQNAIARTDDDAVPGANGNPGGDGDDVDAQNLSGTLSASGGDGALTYDLLTTGAPNGFTYVDGPNGSVLVQQGGVTVLTITVDAATGAYTVTQNAPIDHAAGGAENNASFTINYTATDLDGDSAAGTLTIDVDDDTPVINRLDAATPSLVVDETNLADNATGNFASLFGVSYGADGAGSTSYAVTVVNGTDSGLVDVATGQPILLFNNNGVVEGRVGGEGGAVAFSVSVNTATGVVTLDQVRALDHPNTQDHDDPVSPNATSIQFTVNAIDGDGDPVSATVNIGSSLVFEDDGPAVDVTLSAAGEPTLVTQDADTDGVPGQDSASAEFAGSFTVTPAPGADGQASLVTTYALGVSQQGANSGLTSSGAPIFLYTINGVVVGSTAASQNDVLAGNTVFNVTVDADGTVMMTQFSQIDHPAAGDPSPTGEPFVDHVASLADGLVTLTATATITDGDGDTDSDSEVLNIGANLQFQDDGPAISAVLTGTQIRVDETDGVGTGAEVDAPGGDLGSVTVAAASLFTVTNDNLSADSPTTLSYALTLSQQGVASGLLQSANNAPIYLYNINGQIVGSTATDVDDVEAANTAFTVDIDAATGEVTLTQYLAVEHGDTSSNDEVSSGLTAGVLNVTVTATDFDGDTDQATADLGSVIRFEDDGPTNNQGTYDVGTVHEDALNNQYSDGNPEGVGQIFQTTIFATQLAALVDAGSDTPLTISLNSLATGADSIDGGPTGHTQYGQPIVWDVVSATEIRGVNSVTGQVIFTITDNPNDANFTFTLVDNFDHDSDANLNTGEGDSFLETLQLAGVFTATDADGDPVVIDGGASIDVENDVPAPYSTAPGTATGVNEVGTSDTESLNLPPVGADEPYKLSFGVADGAPVMDTDGEQLSSDGELLVWSLDPNNPSVLTAETTGGTPVFTITLNANGTYTFTQLEEISSTETLSITNLSSVGGGNVAIKAINVPESEFDLILSTQNGNSVNTNATQIGVGQGNSFEGGEHLRVDLVQNAFVSGSGGNAVLNYGEYYSATAYRQDVSGLSGAQRADFVVRAIIVEEAANPAAPADGDDVFYGDTNDDVVAVTTINIYTAAPQIGGTLVDPADYAALGISVTPAAGGGWLITGLPNDYDFEIVSSTPFNAVQIEAAATTDTFKLGFIDITSTILTEVDLQVPVTLTDSDGDPVSNLINIHLDPPIDATAATVTVDEAALGNANYVGSDPASTAETQGGNLNDTIAGGVGPFTFTLLDPADGQFGTLTLNSTTGAFSYTLDTPVDSPDANNGRHVVSGAETFDYQITDTGTGETTTGTITINVIDDVPTARADSDVIASGSNAPATGNVITDNHPGDLNDGDTNAADTVGADQPGRISAISYTNAANQTTTIGVSPDGSQTIDGAFGTLTIFSNGDYSYVRDTGSPGDASDIFTYTLMDADGDTSTNTLTIRIEDAPVTVSIPAGEADTHVYENALGTMPQGTSEAAAAGANDDPNEVVTGTISFTAEDGLGAINIAGTPVNLAGAFPQTVADDATGKLEITGYTFNPATGAGTVSYRYTLEDNTLGVQATNGGNTTVTYDVDIVDGDGDHSPDGNLVITIVDDNPVANDDMGISVNEGGTSAPGNVLTNDLSGADGYMASPNGAVIQITSVNQTTSDLAADGSGNFVLRGQYGELSVNRDGTYSYKADADIASLPANATDTFTYTVRDGDGDIDPATIQFVINPVTVSATDDEASVNEAGLPTIGSDAATDSEKFLTGQIEPSGGVGSYTYTLTSANGGNGTYGTLVLGSDGSYTYVLDTPYDGPDVEGTDTISNAESFTYRVTDSNGNTFNGTIVVSIIDDIPTARADTDFVTEDTKLSATGNVITGEGSDGIAAGGDTKGADGATVTFVDGLNPTIGTTVPDADGNTIQGQYGTLLINSAGAYTYTLYTNANPTAFAAIQALDQGQSVTETFAYTLTDGDGDESIANLVITINGTNDVPNVTGATSIVSDEAMAEEARPGARPNEDNVGIADTGAGATDTDSLTITDADGQTSGFVIALAVPSTSHTVDGVAVTWALSNSVHGPNTVLTGSVAGLGEVIKVELNNTSGGYTVTQSHALDQGGTVNTETDGTITIPVTVSDGIAAPVATTITVKVEDDSPVYTSEVDAAATGPLTFTGDFDYRIGSDEHIEWTTDHEIALTAVRGQVGGEDITIVANSLQFVSADATTEVYTFDFTYQPNPNDPATEQNGATVTFNKATGEYTVVLDSAIESYSTPSVQEDATIAFYGGGPSQWDTAVASFNVGTDDEIHLQFTGDVGDNTQPFTTAGAGTPGSFTDGDIFIGNDSWVSISSQQIAAGGNSLQAKNILDFNFYENNPGATTGGTATTSALGAFIVLDQLGAGEDMVLVLKLADPDNIGGTITTRLVIVEYGDIYVQGETPPEGYPVPGQNQGVIIVEANDYAHLVPEGYQLVGMQLTTSTEGITGSGYNFDGDSGEAATGSTTFAAAGTSDADVIKILDVGVIIPVENQEALNLELDVTVTDADGDSFNQTLLVNPPPPEADAFAGIQSQEAFVSKSTASVGDAHDLQKMNAANTNTMMLGAVAGAGLVSAPAAANGNDASFSLEGGDLGYASTLANGTNSATSESRSAGSVSDVRASVEPFGDGSAYSGSLFAQSIDSNAGVLSDAQSAFASSYSAPQQSLGTQAPTAAEGIFAPQVAMPSAEMLMAVMAPANGSNGERGGIVERMLDGVRGEAQSGDEVGSVLADSLAGGDGVDIDALLSALPGTGAGLSVADMLASHGGVPAWDMGGFGGFTAKLYAPIEDMTVHQDAVQAA